MKTAIYPGSFDPVTNGHLDIIKRASGMFDKLIVVVLINPLKTYSFSIIERRNLLLKATEGMKNIEIDSYDGLLADYFKQRSDVPCACFAVCKHRFVFMIVRKTLRVKQHL